MNTLELKSARIRKGYTQEDMGKLLNLSNVSYGFKERGKIQFNLDEFLIIVKELELDLNNINTIFFNQELTEVIRKFDSNDI